jgi:type 1 glutamine amidotransferase
MRNHSHFPVCLPLVAFLNAGCGDTGLSVEDLNKGFATQTATATTAAAPSTAAPSPTMTTVETPPTASTTGAEPVPSVVTPMGSVSSDPFATAEATATTAPPVTTETMPSATAPEPSASAIASETAPSASAEPEPPVVTAYSPRTGSFKMLIYKETPGHTHDSIPAGVKMLQDIGTEQGFETVVAEDNRDITLEGLSQYEIVFFMNSTGDIFTDTQQKAYEDWMTTKNGAFGGAHSATDTEQGWAFYSEVTGQYYNGHGGTNDPGTIQWKAGTENLLMVKGLPSPWARSEEWYQFNSAASWSSKAGFTILSTVDPGTGSRPVSYIREYGNFRSFYTSMGHLPSTFQDANVKKHIAAGIMWAVRREAEYVAP